jgi:hypothetical protein
VEVVVEEVVMVGDVVDVVVEGLVVALFITT